MKKKKKQQKDVGHCLSQHVVCHKGHADLDSNFQHCNVPKEGCWWSFVKRGHANHQKSNDTKKNLYQTMFVFINQRRVKIIYGENNISFLCVWGFLNDWARLLQLFFCFFVFFFSLPGACENASMFLSLDQLFIVLWLCSFAYCRPKQNFFIRNATKHKNESDTVAVM